jgi:monovalent cation:H+ antiporter, CPA1 family
MPFPFAGFVWLLLLAALTAGAARRLHVPYTVALVLVGLLVSAAGLFHDVRPSGEVILLVFLPPLLFEAALDFDVEALGRALPEIIILAIPGLVVSAALIGVVLAHLTPLPIWPALLFGALISATDPVSVVATFRQLGAPADLSAIVEGESVLNDGTAVTLAAVLLTAAQTGHLDVGNTLLHFSYSLAAAVAIGSATGLALSLGTRLLNDDLVETTLTMVLTYGTYLSAEHAGASGIIAVVCAGLVFGTLGRRFGLTIESRRLLDGFWRTVGFLANAILFILIGLEVRVGVLWHELGWVLPAIAIVLVARAAIVYFLTLTMHRVHLAYGHVLFWGGLRGGVALAVALSLPASVPGHSLILGLTFGVVLFTILIQGLTIEPLVRRLGLLSTSGEEGEG